MSFNLSSTYMTPGQTRELKVSEHTLIENLNSTKIDDLCIIHNTWSNLIEIYINTDCIDFIKREEHDIFLVLVNTTLTMMGLNYKTSHDLKFFYELPSEAYTKNKVKIVRKLAQLVWDVDDLCIFNINYYNKNIKNLNNETVKESIPVSSMDHYVNEDTRIAQTITHLNDLYESTQDNASSNEVFSKYHIRALYKTLKYICINHHVDYNKLLAELPEPAEIDCCDNDIKTKARTKLLAVIKSLSNYFVDLSKKIENKINNIIDVNSLVKSADKSSSTSNNKLDNIAVSLKGEDRVIFNIKPLSAIKNFNNLTSPDTVAVKVNVTIKNNNILYDDVRIAIDKFLEIVSNYHPCEQYIVNPKTPDAPIEYYHNTSVLSDRTYTYGLGNDAVLGLYDLDNIYIYVPNVYVYNDGVWELDTNLIYNSLKEFVNNNTNIFTLKG